MELLGFESGEEIGGSSAYVLSFWTGWMDTICGCCSQWCLLGSDGAGFKVLEAALTFGEERGNFGERGARCDGCKIERGDECGWR